MHTARIPPVDPAPAAITAALAMHAGHIFPSSELLRSPRVSQALSPLVEVEVALSCFESFVGWFLRPTGWRVLKVLLPPVGCSVEERVRSSEIFRAPGICGVSVEHLF